MSEQLTLHEALDEEIMVSRAQAQAKLKKHGESLLSYFSDHPDEMYNEEFSSAKLLTWLGY